MPEIRDGAMNTKIVDGKEIDPVFLSTTSNKLFEPVESGYLINSKDYKQKQAWMNSIAKKLIYSYESNSNTD